MKKDAGPSNTAKGPSISNIKGPVSRRTLSEAPDTFAVLETYIVIPPDGGWGWVIVFIAFFSNFVADGTMYCFGIFLEDISLTINSPVETVAVTNSIMTGSYFFLAPVVSALTNRFGYRIIAMMGAFIASMIHLYISYFATFLSFLIVYGFLGGLGFGMMYMPTIIAVSYYFEKWRALTNAIAATGSSLGIIVFPLVFKIILGDKDWQYNFRIISILALCSTALNSLYRQLVPVRIVNVEDKKVQFANQSYISMNEEIGPRFSLTKYTNLAFPTTADIYEKGGVALVSQTANTGSVLGLVGPTNAASRSSFRFLAASYKGERLHTLLEDEEDGSIYGYENENRNICLRCGRSCKKCLCYPCSCSSNRQITPPVRPMYRDDIFYSASMAHLPEYAQSMHTTVSRMAPVESYAIDYHLSVTRVTTQKDALESHRCVICPEAVKRPLATMLDMRLLKSPTFLLLSVSGFFTMLGVYTPFMFIAERAKQNGMDPDLAFSLVTTLGISNTIGRITGGIMSSLPNINAMRFSYISLSICGISTLLSSLSATVAWQFGYASIFASTIACLAALRPIIIVDMLGLERLTSACGLSLLFQGLACFIGVPLSAYLKSLTGGYNASFYFSGTVIFLSAVMLIFVGYLDKWEKSRNVRNN